MKKHSLLLFAICLIISFFAVNTGITLFTQDFSFDFTPDKRYTLNQATKNWLKNNQSKLFARLYVSPELNNEYTAQIMHVLERYKQNSHNLFSVSLIETPAFSPTSTEAEKFGIIPLGNKETPQYLGLVLIDENGQSKTISYLNPDKIAYLEHDISRNLSSLNDYKKPKIGILSPALPVIKGNSGFDYGSDWTFIKNLRQYYDINQISNGIAQIPLSYKAVIVINPRQIENNTTYALEQYLLRGGNLIIFYDPFSEAFYAQNGKIDNRPSGLENFLQNLGIEYDYTLRNPEIIIKENQLTQNIKKLHLTSAGSFNVYNDNLSFIELLSSIQGSIAGILEGTFYSSYKQPPFNTFDTKKNPFVSISIAPGKVILLSDSDLLHDALWLRTDNHSGYINNNFDLIERLVDFAAANNTLLSIIPQQTFITCNTLNNKFKLYAQEKYAPQIKKIKTEKQAIEEQIQQIREDINNGKTVLSLKKASQIETLQKELLAFDKNLRQKEDQIKQYTQKIQMLFIIANIIVFPGITILILYIIIRILRIRNQKFLEKACNEQ